MNSLYDLKIGSAVDLASQRLGMCVWRHNVNKHGDSSPYSIKSTSKNIHFFNGEPIQYYNLGD